MQKIIKYKNKSIDFSFIDELGRVVNVSAGDGSIAVAETSLDRLNKMFQDRKIDSNIQEFLPRPDKEKAPEIKTEALFIEAQKKQIISKFADVKNKLKSSIVKLLS